MAATDDNVSLKELFDRHQQAHAREHELIVREIDTRFRESEKALGVALVELNRRLDILNHAHEAAQEERRTTVTRDVFDLFSKELNQWKSGVDSRLSNSEGRAAAYAFAIGIFFSIVVIALHFVKT